MVKPSGRHDFVPLQSIIWGTPAAEAVAQTVEREGAQRVMMIVSNTLNSKTDEIDKIKAGLGDKCVGVFDRCIEHVPLESVMEAVALTKETSPDLLLTVGGGTPIDLAKVVIFALSDNLDSVEALRERANSRQRNPSKLRQIIVPTTLSGGENSTIGGGTDTTTKDKNMYLGPDTCGKAIIFDPAITLHTPEWLWLSTGVRAVDHAVESYCADDAHPLIEAQALHALRLFSRALRQVKQDPSDLSARLECQWAVALASSSIGRVPMGASHGIGYVLGTVCGVPHGYTSCVMLPHVLQWNEPVTEAKQAAIAEALGSPHVSAADAVAALLNDIGMPRKLENVDVRHDQLELIAEKAAVHPVVRSNPRLISSPEDVMEILKMAF